MKFLKQLKTWLTEVITNIKKSRLHVSMKLNNADQYKVNKLICKKKKDDFENKLNVCIGSQSYGKP